MTDSSKSGAKRSRVVSLSDETQIPLPQRSLHPATASDSTAHPHLRDDDSLNSATSSSGITEPASSQFVQTLPSIFGESLAPESTSGPSAAPRSTTQDYMEMISSADFGNANPSLADVAMKQEKPQELYLVLKKGIVDSEAKCNVLAVFRDADEGKDAADEYVATLWQEAISNDEIIARIYKETTGDEVWFRKPGYASLYETRTESGLSGSFGWTGPRRGMDKDEGTFQIQVQTNIGQWRRKEELFVVTGTSFGMEDRTNGVEVRILLTDDNQVLATEELSVAKDEFIETFCIRMAKAGKGFLPSKPVYPILNQTKDLLGPFSCICII